MTKTEKFTHDGCEFEKRAAALDHGVEAKTFHKGKQIATYSAAYETAGDMLHEGWSNVTDNLTNFAKADIEHDQLPGLKAVIEAALAAETHKRRDPRRPTPAAAEHST